MDGDHFGEPYVFLEGDFPSVLQEEDNPACDLYVVGFHAQMEKFLMFVDDLDFLNHFFDGDVCHVCVHEPGGHITGGGKEPEHGDVFEGAEVIGHFDGAGQCVRAAAGDDFCDAIGGRWQGLGIGADALENAAFQVLQHGHGLCVKAHVVCFHDFPFFRFSFTIHHSPTKKSRNRGMIYSLTACSFSRGRR